ncbi:MAG: transglutaminase domain-containing protein [Ruminococcus sp.]
MFKRIIALVLVLILACSFSGCNLIRNKLIDSDKKIETDKVEPETETAPKVKNDITLSPYYDSIDTTNCYDTLETDSERKCYKEIATHVTDITSKTDGKYFLINEFKVYDCYLTERQLAKVVDAFQEDHSEIFWFSGSYLYYVGSDYVSIALHSLLSKSQYNSYTKKFYKAVSKILSGLKGNMSEFERALYLHDYLVNNCEYDENVDEENDEDQYSSYGALVNKLAVCEGYAEAYHYLLSCVGINSLNISGFSDGDDHEWNIVNIDGEWYHTDVTWDDCGEEYMYDYFNLTTNQIEKDHTINPLCEEYTDAEIIGDENHRPVNFNFYVPECTETYYNYYVYCGSVLHDIDDNTLVEDLADTMENKDKYFHIYVDPNYLNYNTTYNQLFGDVYNFQHYIEKANRMSKNTLSTRTYSMKKKNLNTITVELEYI